MKIIVEVPGKDDAVFDDDALPDGQRYEMRTDYGVLNVNKCGPTTPYGRHEVLVFAVAGKYDAIQVDE